MNTPPEPSDAPATEASTRQGRIGFGTVSILVIFFGIITAMCIGSVLIIVVLAFR